MRSIILILKFSLIALILYGFAYNLQTIFAHTGFSEQPSKLPEALSKMDIQIPEQSGIWQVKLKNSERLMVHQQLTKLGNAEVSLCEQNYKMANDLHLIPILGGLNQQQLAQLVAYNKELKRPLHYGLKNLLLDGFVQGQQSDINVPAFKIIEHPGFPLSHKQSLLTIKTTGQAQADFVTDRHTPAYAQNSLAESGAATGFKRHVWMLWDKADISDNHSGLFNQQRWHYALHIQRRASASCNLGQLRFELFQSESGEGSLELGTDSHTAQVYFLPRSNDKAILSLKIKPGFYPAKTADYSKEDDVLFAQLLAEGLIKLQKNGQIIIAPRELKRVIFLQKNFPQWVTMNPVNQHFLSLGNKADWDDKLADLFDQLHYQPAGRYIKQQIENYNARQLIAALRIGPDSSDLFKTSIIQASSASHLLKLQTQMPVLSGQLFAKLPQGWQHWQRVVSGNHAIKAKDRIYYEIVLPWRSKGGEKLEILVLGKGIEIDGVKIISKQARCFAQPCSWKNAIASHLKLKLNSGFRKIKIRLQPRSGQFMQAFNRYEFSHIIKKNGQLSWRQSRTLAHTMDNKHSITISDRNGLDLMQDSVLQQPLVEKTGLAALLGVDSRQQGSLREIFSRTQQPVSQVQLTLDSRMQTLAQSIIERQTQLTAASWKEPVSKRLKKDPYGQQRFSSIVVLDADTGEILVSSHTPRIPAQMQWSDLQAYDSAHYQQSPLRIRAWQHDGSNRHTPGSTFKMLSALALEHEAANDPERLKLLQGVDKKALNKAGQLRGFNFLANAGCYPASANCRGLTLSNYNYEKPTDKMLKLKDKTYGLEQAIRDSMNTWFAWQVETVDKSLLQRGDIAGIATIKSLSWNAEDVIHPLNGIARRLGFFQSHDLTAGLLKSTPLKQGDVLSSTPSNLDPYQSRHNIRQAALGMRVQVTPLQMAIVAASIATDKIVTPGLLLSLNANTAKVKPFKALAINTSRIRRGMKRVPQDGSAKMAFKDKSLKQIREHLFAKTGTGSIISKAELYSVWLTGWLEPGAIKGEKRKLAFACMISHSKKTGGKECGPAMAAFFKAWDGELNPDKAITNTVKL